MDDVLRTKSPRPDGLTVSAQTLWRYQYGNHLGSVTLELDDTARVISYGEFHPYGTSAYRLMNSALEAPPKRYRYTGMERDEESGLSYHRNRCYSSPLTRWTSRDPAGIKAGIDTYAYGNSNPIRLVDNDGRAAMDTVGGYYVGFWDAILGLKTDVRDKRADFQAAYAKTQDALNWRHFRVVKGISKDVASNQASADIAGGTLGLMSGFVPGAPDGSDLPPTMQRSYRMMRFASSNATAIVGGMEMIQSIPPPSGPSMGSGPRPNRCASAHRAR